MESAFAVLALSLAAPAQEKITLKFQPRPGDRLVEQEKTSMKVALTVLAGGQTLRLETEQRESHRKVHQILEAADGRITKAVFEYEEDVEEKKPPGAEEFTKLQKPLHGRKVTLELKDGKLVRQGVEGLDEGTLKPLDLDDEFAASFPKAPIAKGDSWEISGDALRKMFGEQELDGKMKLKLAEVKDFQGKRCAFLDTELDMKGEAEEGVHMAASLKGTVVVWIERGYTLQVRLAGKMSMKAKTPEVDMSGEGPMTVDVDVTLR
jgi:hypothetical protein